MTANNFAQLDPEEKLLVARVEDLANIAATRDCSRFSSFLNERQQQLVQEVIRRRKLEGCLLYGGYPDAVRRMLGVFPTWRQPEEEEFPVVAVTIHLPKDAALTHRDVLGSLMGLHIVRESVGDILFGERRCDVFVQQKLAQLIVDELRKVGRTGVRCEIGASGDYHRDEQFQDKRVTVSSVRLDALVSAMTGISREKGAAMIRSELVQHNYRTARSVSAAFLPGDVITIRGYGKYRVDDIGKPTKKGRLPVLIRKYI